MLWCARRGGGGASAAAGRGAGRAFPAALRGRGRGRGRRRGGRGVSKRARRVYHAPAARGEGGGGAHRPEAPARCAVHCALHFVRCTLFAGVRAPRATPLPRDGTPGSPPAARPSPCAPRARTRPAAQPPPSQHRGARRAAWPPEAPRDPAQGSTRDAAGKTCPLSTGGRTRRVQLVQGGGHTCVRGLRSARRALGHPRNPRPSAVRSWCLLQRDAACPISTG